MNSINELWDDYQKKVLTDKVGDIQVQETRRAFYAAAYGTFTMLMQLPEDLSEEASNGIMDGFYNEFEEFRKGIKNGKY